MRPPSAARFAEYWPLLFFEADARRRQVGGIDQPDRCFPPGIGLDQRLEQVLVDPPQSRHTQAGPELVQHAHARHLALAAQTGELPPRALLRQHFHQEVQGMDGREQAQQMHSIELSGGVLSRPAASAAGGPGLIDEVVRNERGQQFEQLGRAGRGKVGIHRSQPTSGNLTRQRQRRPLRFSTHFFHSQIFAETFATPSPRLRRHATGRTVESSASSAAHPRPASPG